MVRISGVDLPRNKRIEIGLTYIFGIGLTSSKQILASTSISPDKLCLDLTDEEINALRTLIDEKYQTEGDLRRVYSLNIKRLRDLGTYRGTRHRKKLPVRGQRTSSNARTRKGKAVAIAGKKLTLAKK